MWRTVLLSWWLLGTLASCCPLHCRCSTDDDGYKIANCSKTGLVSGDLAPTIDVLNFKNQLRGSQTKLEAKIFRNFRAIKHLNLQNSSISQLPNDVFYGLSRVVRIDLSFNKIKHLNGVVFNILPSLRFLSLRGNFLRLSPLEVIISETLQELDMGLCSLTNIPLYTFSSAPSLRRLILDGNFIQTLEYNVLPKGLTYLNLANNNIVKPPINVFNSLRYLIRLDISKNPINCSCSLLVFQDTLSGRAGLLENDVTCANPPHLFGKKISVVNENQLCRDDYMNREGLNNWIHSRSKKSHHHSHQIGGFQSDEPVMGDESYGTREADGFMYTNDETNQMGTHMEARTGTINGENIETLGNNKLTEDMHDTTTPDQNFDIEEIHEKPIPKNDNLEKQTETEYPEASTTHRSDENDVKDITLDHTTMESSVSKNELVPNVDRNGLREEVEITSNDESSTDENTIDASVYDSASSVGDHSNTLHVFGSGNKTDPLFSALPDHQSSSMATQDDFGGDFNSDVEIFSNNISIPETHLELVNEESTTENNKPSENLYTLPTSATESADYSYDVHHDYGGVDKITSTELSNEEKVEGHTGESSTTISDDEGSGFHEDDTTTQSNHHSNSTIGFLEEQDGETESSSLRTVSDDLSGVPSSTSSDPTVQSSTSSTSEETVSDQLTTESEDFTVSSEKISDLVSSTELSFISSSTTETSTDIGYTEVTEETSVTDEVVTTVEADYSSEVTREITTDHSTETFYVASSSTEPSSTSYSLASSSESTPTDFYTTAEQASSTDATSTSEKFNFWFEDDFFSLSSSSSSSSTSSSDFPSSTASEVQRKGKMIESTTEASSTIVSEVELVTAIVGTAENENIIVDPSLERSVLMSNVTYIIIGLLIALVIVVLFTIVMCKRRKKSTKIRLPSDPETAAGTEMQDMLLPKPPENGIKVLPKNCSNGSTPVTNGKTKDPELDKEESIPVLTSEPDNGWDDKPEPIETVTARLTMLARPQTPIFIQKTLT